MDQPEETTPPKSSRRCRPPRRPAACALITGATGGIGEAFAAALPKETALVLTGRDEAALATLAITCGGNGRAVTTVTADLATEAGQEAVIEAAETGGVDLLINNAGLGAYGPFLDEPFETHRSAVRVNVEASLALIHRLLPGMIERARLADSRAGLINMSSSTAFVPVPTFATYAASKSFVLAFTESLAAELYEEPIDVLVSCPGAVKTEFGRRAGYARGSLPGAMSPEKVASATLAALGRQTTVVLGPASSLAFTPVALARGLFGQAFIRASRAMTRL
jgi:short-subunit dehydrogenase